MSMYKFSEFVKEFRYYAFASHKVKREDGKFSHGFLYILSDGITEAQKKRLSEFDNVKIFVSQSQYAPEQKKPAIFIGNSAIRGTK